MLRIIKTKSIKFKIFIISAFAIFYLLLFLAINQYFIKDIQNKFILLIGNELSISNQAKDIKNCISTLNELVSFTHITKINEKENTIKIEKNYKSIMNRLLTLKKLIDKQHNLKLSKQIKIIIIRFKGYIQISSHIKLAFEEDYEDGIDEFYALHSVVKRMSNELEQFSQITNKNFLYQISSMNQKLDNSLEYMIYISIFIIIVFSYFSRLIGIDISNNLNKFRKGLKSFFNYLKDSNNKVIPIEIDSNEELISMSLFVNDNIKTSIDIHDKIKYLINLMDKHILITEIDKNYNITYASTAILNLTKYDKDEVIGNKYVKMLGLANDCIQCEEIKREIEQNKTWSGEFKNVDKDGKEYWVYSIITPKSDKNNNFDGFTSISQDITDKKEIETLEKNQENLIYAFIQLLAKNIDAKSKYTGGHCSRVPEITYLIAKEVNKDTNKFKDINFTENQLEELDVSAWLHDCGKVITPEYVVDKATKLETLYNRIHEIRTRFDIIYRDKIIESLKNNKSKEWLEKEYQKLKDDFTFISKVNIGNQFITDEDIKRINEISSLKWTRNFNKTIGISKDEISRLGDDAHLYPMVENLLEDKQEQIIPHNDLNFLNYEKNNFNVDIPDNLYNLGELHNLKIPMGTLTNEERFKINEHVIMTIYMLESLPFPRKFKNVVKFAGNHHETLDGKGYPNKLKDNMLSIESRMIAIADIFEALTAKDRPYKNGKTLKEALDILYSMVKVNKLDKDLFELFITNKIYKNYADRFLDKTQICDINIEDYGVKI